MHRPPTRAPRIANADRSMYVTLGGASNKKGISNRLCSLNLRRRHQHHNHLLNRLVFDAIATHLHFGIDIEVQGGDFPVGRS